jgi:hypothetical protein
VHDVLPLARDRSACVGRRLERRRERLECDRGDLGMRRDEDRGSAANELQCICVQRAQSHAARRLEDDRVVVRCGVGDRVRERPVGGTSVDHEDAMART